MSTRGQLKANIRTNLADSGVVHFTEDDLNESMQDAYDDIALLTGCIIKNTQLDWVSNLSYYEFKSLGVVDYLSTIAIFNNVTNWWLRDDLNFRDFDRIRRDWENWIGTPQFWAPCTPERIAIAAKYLGTLTGGAFNASAFSNAYFIGSGSNDVGSFVLYYSAIAPTFNSDADVPLVASDMQTLFEHYGTADLLEQDQEYTKSLAYWDKYYSNILEYKQRIKNLAKSDLLLRI